jgi:hypothetical protein
VISDVGGLGMRATPRAMIDDYHRQHAGYGNGRCHHDRAAQFTA